MSEHINENSGRVMDSATGLTIPKKGTQAFFTAAMIAVVAGLLFPPSARILDVFWIFSLSLTAAVLIITFCARGALEATGFPSLIILATMLRIAISVASSKQTISQNNSNTILNFVGSVFVSNNSVFAILLFCMLTIIIFSIIYKAVKSIRYTSAEFTTNIVPIKQISIDSDLNAKIIDSTFALNLREKVGREASFFVSMSKVGGFILCAAAIELTTIIVNIFTGVTASATTLTGPEASAKAYTSAIGGGMTIEITALVIAAASAHLVRKSCLSAVANDGIPKIEFAKRIKVVTNEMLSQEPVESELQEGNSLFPTQAETIVEELEWFNEPQCSEDANQKNELDNLFWNTANGGNHYEEISELILSKSVDGTKTILMAAESTAELPVTIPVNIAMRLAEKQQECLLVDLDFERGAISKVFDIDYRNLKEQTRAISTCINGLRVWPAIGAGKDNRAPDTGSLKQALDDFEGQFDCLIIYAPNIKLLDSYKNITDCVEAAMFFGPAGKIESSPINELNEILNSHGCKILKPVEVSSQLHHNPKAQSGHLVLQKS